MQPRQLLLTAAGCGIFLGILGAGAVNPVMKPPVEAQWRKDLRALAMSRMSYRYAEAEPEDLYPPDTTDQMAPMFTIEIASVAGPGFRARPVLDYGNPVAEEPAGQGASQPLDAQPEALPSEPQRVETVPIEPDHGSQNAAVEVLQAGPGSVTISG